MQIPNKQHVEFYEWQINVIEEEWERYANTSMKLLIQEKRLFVGRIWGVEETHGNVVLRFKTGLVPRMKQPYILCIVGTGASTISADWDFTYLQFRISDNPRLSGFNTEIKTINYLKSDDAKWSYVLVNGFDQKLLAQIKDNFLTKDNHPLVVVAESDPPIDYLLKLKEFVSNNPNDDILNLDVTVDEQGWSPNSLDNSKTVTKKVIDLLACHSSILIQGPPGTGKSYLAAEICEQFLSKGLSICVTALTNKALMEIADKDGLKLPLDQGKVSKTNLSSDEFKLISKLKPVDDLAPIQGELLLSTYYKLSQKQAELEAGKKRFDLLVIEEASQAYLATIAMFNSIAKKLLIIGDHKQLTPVVKQKEQTYKIHPKIDGIINGLETFAFNNNDISNRLTFTRRLTTDAANLTAVYYQNTLKSISDDEGKTKFTSKYFEMFHSNGGISIAKLPASMQGFTEMDLIRFICEIGHEILHCNSKIEIALLSPYIKVESDLYNHYSRLSSDYSRVTLNTIHKIQGLTTDVTILYLPLNNPSFDLDANLFNVATSRAKKGTLIVTYKQIELLTGLSPETMMFIHKCQDVSSQFDISFKSFINK
jgi:DNA replication ATP-dependent helicase Dna2